MFVVAETMAVNCCLAPGGTVAVGGIMVTLIPCPHSNNLGEDVTLGEPGLVTVKLPLPESVKLLVTFNCVEETNVVGIATPSSMTTAPLTKFVPLTVNVVLPSGTGCGENH